MDGWGEFVGSEYDYCGSAACLDAIKACRERDKQEDFLYRAPYLHAGLQKQLQYVGARSTRKTRSDRAERRKDNAETFGRGLSGRTAPALESRSGKVGVQRVRGAQERRPAAVRMRSALRRMLRALLPVPPQRVRATRVFRRSSTAVLSLLHKNKRASHDSARRPATAERRCRDSRGVAARWRSTRSGRPPESTLFDSGRAREEHALHTKTVYFIPSFLRSFVR